MSYRKFPPDPPSDRVLYVFIAMFFVLLCANLARHAGVG